MNSFTHHKDTHRCDVIYEYSPSGDESAITSSAANHSDCKSNTEDKSVISVTNPAPCTKEPAFCDVQQTQQKEQQEKQKENSKPYSNSRAYKVRLNSVLEQSTPSKISAYHSSSLSTLSSITESINAAQKPFTSASPEAHLSKLKSIHRKAKRRKRLRRMRRAVHCFITKLLVLLLLLISTVLLLCGYFITIRYLLVSGCILLLAAVGLQVQLCFTERTSPNKFNPMSVPFCIPADDLKEIDTELSKQQGEGTCNGQSQDPVQATVRTTDMARQLSGFSDVQSKRISLALARVANNALQMPRHPEGETGVLRLARRLTMASSAIGMGSHDPMLSGNSWLTGSQIRHGVRRSLAWNATGASRFYEQNYD